MSVPKAMTMAVILGTVVLDAVGIALIMPVMPALLEEIGGGTLARAAVWGGILATSFAVMQFAFGPLVGNLSDRFGRRPVMLWSLTVMAANYLVMALAGTLWLLLVGRLMAGIASATQSTAAAYVADLSPPERRARGFGLIGAAFGVGFILGPVLGGLLADYGTRVPFYAAALIGALNLVAGLRALPETLPRSRRRPLRWRAANPVAQLGDAARLPGVGRLLVVYAVIQIANYVYPAIWAYYGTAQFGWSASMIGVSLAVYGGAYAAVQAGLVGPMVRWLGERRALLAGLSIDLIALIFFGLNGNGWAAILFTPLAAVGSVTTPALQALASRAAPEDAQGALQGVLSSLNAIAMILAPLLFTATFAAFTRPGTAIHLPGAPFLLAAAMMVVCIAVYVARPHARTPA